MTLMEIAKQNPDNEKIAACLKEKAELFETIAEILREDGHSEEYIAWVAARF